MGKIKRLLQLGGVLAFGTTGGTLYYFPELRKNPEQLFKASMCVGRCVYYGLRMLSVYYHVIESSARTFFRHRRFRAIRTIKLLD